MNNPRLQQAFFFLIPFLLCLYLVANTVAGVLLNQAYPNKPISASLRIKSLISSLTGAAEGRFALIFSPDTNFEFTLDSHLVRKNSHGQSIYLFVLPSETLVLLRSLREIKIQNRLNSNFYSVHSEKFWVKIMWQNHKLIFCDHIDPPMLAELHQCCL